VLEVGKMGVEVLKEKTIVDGLSICLVVDSVQLTLKKKRSSV